MFLVIVILLLLPLRLRRLLLLVVPVRVPVAGGVGVRGVGVRVVEFFFFEKIKNVRGADLSEKRFRHCSSVKCVSFRTSKKNVTCL